jgi:hypothetical protein
MLHWLYTYVANVCFKCFSCFKRTLQVFYLDVTYVALPIHMLQEYVVNVSSVSDVCCSKCFSCNMSARGRRRRWVPSGTAVPAWAREAKQAWSTKVYPWAWLQA